MARKRKQPARSGQRLTLDLDGVLTATQFRRAVNAFVDMLDAVTKDVAGSARAVRWTVSVEAGSNRVHAFAEAPASTPRARIPQVAGVVSQGLKLIERKAQRPKHFSDAALVAAHELGVVAGGRELRAKVRADAAAVEMTQRVVTHVETLLAARFQDSGTIEGRLQTLSERGGLHFAVYDALTDQAVRCQIAPQRMQEAWQAFGKRVAVSGPIRYRRDGQPISIDVEELEVFPPEAELPTADDVLGILGGAQ